MSWRHPRPLLILGGIFAAAIALHLSALLYTRPFCCDNLVILEWAHQASLRDVIAGDTRYPLEWRPLPHLLVWAQYRFWGLGSLAPFFLVNIGIWTGVVWLVFRLARQWTGSVLAAGVGAAFLLTARRTSTLTGYLMGTQTGLACLFGLAAVNVALTGPPSRARTAGVFALLLFAGLGKEYGLAFAGGLALWGLLRQRRDLALAGSGALAVYLALRISVTGDVPPCEQQAFLSGHREVCPSHLDLTTATQMAYNVGLGMVHTLFPGFVNGEGMVGVSWLRLLQSAFWLPFIVTGARRGGALPLLALLVLTANAVLLAPIFRSRNTLVGVAMLAIVIAVGFQHIREWCRERHWVPMFRLLCAGAVLVCIHRASIIPPNVDFTARSTALDDPCEVLDAEPVDPSFVTHVKTVYGLPDPHCSGSAPERVLQRPELTPPSDRDDWM